MVLHQASIDIANIREALKRPLPGLAAQLQMAPPQRPNIVPKSEIAPRDAGVLMLLYPVHDELHFVLTRRTEHLDKHKGQISLPGGRHETGDVSFVETALRETHEELGIDVKDAEVIGALTSLWVAPSNFVVHPIVAYTQLRPHFCINEDEVAEVIESPISKLLDPSIVGVERRSLISLNGAEQPVPHYLLGGHKVWGATAMVLAEFAAVIAQTASQEPTTHPSLPA